MTNMRDGDVPNNRPKLEFAQGELIESFEFSKAERERLMLTLSSPDPDLRARFIAGAQFVIEVLNHDGDGSASGTNELIEQMRDVHTQCTRVIGVLAGLNENQLAALAGETSYQLWRQQKSDEDPEAFLQDLCDRLAIFNEASRRLGSKEIALGAPRSNKERLISTLAESYWSIFSKIPPSSKHGDFAAFVEELFGILNIGGSGRTTVEEVVGRMST